MENITSIFFPIRTLRGQCAIEGEEVTGPVGGGGDVGEAELLEKPYHCNPPCEFSTTTKGNLLQHQNNSRCYHKRPFACDKCSQRFTTQHGKDQHFVKGRCGVWVWRGDPSMM